MNSMWGLAVGGIIILLFFLFRGRIEEYMNNRDRNNKEQELAELSRLKEQNAELEKYNAFKKELEAERKKNRELKQGPTKKARGPVAYNLPAGSGKSLFDDEHSIFKTGGGKKE